MRKLLLSTVFVSLALTGVANAGGGGHYHRGSGNTNVNANLNLNNNTADARAGAFAGSVSHNTNKNWLSQSQGQYQGQSNDVRNEGDTNDVRITTAPNLAGLVASPHTCMGSSSLSGGGGGVFSLGVGTTYRDRECDLREAIKLAAQLGLTSEAVELFRQLDVVRDRSTGGSTGTGTARNTTAGAGELGRESGGNVPPVTLVEWWRGGR